MIYLVCKRRSHAETVLHARQLTARDVRVITSCHQIHGLMLRATDEVLYVSGDPALKDALEQRRHA